MVPTRGRAGDLRRCLDSLAATEPAGFDWEVVVVDNGPSDGTAAACAPFMDRERPRFRRVVEPEPGLLAGRHRGAAEADGAVLAYLDDDVTVAPGWPAAIRGCFDDPEVHLAGGPSLPDYEGDPPAWLEGEWDDLGQGRRSLGALSLLDLGGAPGPVDPAFVWGLNLAVRAGTLREAGGFHPDALPWELRRFRGDGETGLAQAIARRGLGVVHEPRARVRHRVPRERMTVEYLERRSHLQGISASYAAVREAGGARLGLRRAPLAVGLLRGLWRLGGAQRRGRRGDIRRRTDRAFVDGYRYHQREVRRDPALLEWVLRRDYWDWRLPDRGERA